ncbi:MAG: MFS transporter [Acidobacteriota bacterium]|nr:MFS transporter [Acidobacteriota bacterium]
MKLLDTLVPPDFRGAITRPVRRFYLCTFINCVGFGLILSLFVVYLHNVRGFSESFATALLAVSSVVGLASAPLWGTLIDHFGPVRVSLTVTFFNAAALIYWAFMHTHAQAIFGAVALALVGGAGWGPGAVLMSRLVPEIHRQRAFGVNFMLVNLGIGFGGLVAALLVNLQHPGTFEVLYVGNALLALVASGLLWTLRAHGGPVPVSHDDPAKANEGWRVVLADRRLVRYVGALVLLMLGGYGALDTGLSLFVVNNLHASVHAIGVIFFFNTSTIVLAQLWMLNRIAGHSRSRVLALVGACWFLFWIILGSSLAMPKIFAVAAVCLAMVIFAIGEIMLQPVGTAMVNEMAPEHLRGRYNAAAGFAWGVSGTLAPAMTSVYFSLHLGNWWPLGTGLTALVGSFMMLNLRRSLSAKEDGRLLAAAG